MTNDRDMRSSGRSGHSRSGDHVVERGSSGSDRDSRSGLERDSRSGLSGSSRESDELSRSSRDASRSSGDGRTSDSGVRDVRDS